MRAGPLPQVISRAISWPAKLAAHTLLPMRLLGVAKARTRCSMPRSRRTSPVRWLVMWARGVRGAGVLRHRDGADARPGEQRAGRQSRRPGTNHENVGFASAHGRPPADVINRLDRRSDL